MTPAIASSFLPMLRRLDPEQAHRIALLGLRFGLAGRCATPDPSELATVLAGMPASNPIGLAAGFDKDAVAATGLIRLGFGAVEVGTVTPRPQYGNVKPRLFRLEDGAVINRMGMNNEGLAPFIRQLARMSARGRPAGVLIGANVGINKDDADPLRDYPALVAATVPHVDYIALNVSSPNTAGLRALQARDRLQAILQGVMAVNQDCPVFVKVAPDMDAGSLEQVVATAVAGGAAGLVVSNTTTDRPPTLRGHHAAEAGGLSGPPLMQPSTAMLARAYRLAQGKLALIGCGGVTNGRDVLTKLQAGAHIVQMYASFAMHGPALIPRLKLELLAALRQEGFASVTEAIGTRVRELA